MRYGLDVAQQRLEWDEVVSRARFAEALGFDGIWGFDHFQPMYGEGPGPCFEGMTTLAALASATTTIRLGLLVAGVTYRHPSLLAAQALTIDHASHGRLELTLGAAWFEDEHRALGFDFPPRAARFDRLEDALEVVTRLLSGERSSYDGRTMRLDDAQMLPQPVQRPRPPIWIGGTGRQRTLPLAARFADVWHGFGSPESYADASRHLDDLAAAGGRDPSAITRAASVSLGSPIDDVRRAVDGWRNVGVGYVVCGWPAEGRPAIERFAREFRGSPEG